MGVKQLSSYQNDLIFALGDPSLDAGMMAGWVNDALREIAYAFKFPELQAVGSVDTIQGTASYPVPNDFRSLADTGVHITSPQERVRGNMDAETRWQYNAASRYADSAYQGQPRYYHMFGKKIWFRPVPDGTVTTVAFDYWKSITPLSAPTDKSPLNDDWDEPIFRGALVRGYMILGQHDRMVNMVNMFLTLVRSRMLAQDLEEFPEGGISVIESQYANLIRR